LKTAPRKTSSSTAGPKITTTKKIAGTATPGLSSTQCTRARMKGPWTVLSVEYPRRSRMKALAAFMGKLAITAPTPTATPTPVPARIPPLGRRNPRGASE
jgi:hypothetical protein